MDDRESAALLAPSPETLAQVKVFPLIAHLKKDVVDTIDSPLSWEQLTASDINFAIIRPLVFKYTRLHNLASVYACLVVRSHFLSASEGNLAYASLMQSRATLCEIIAMKLSAHFASNQIQLVAVLTTNWNPLAGATDQIVQQVRHTLKGDEVDNPQSALEMAVFTQAKAFLSSSVVQSVINDIYTGRIVFSVFAHRSVLADNYKPRAIKMYDPSKAPFLDHYRLRVPKYGAILEFLNFSVLLTIYLLFLSTHNIERMNIFEMIFVVYVTAFTLGEYTATKEHGWTIYIANMWNVFDSAFVVIFLAYLGLRIKGIWSGDAYFSQLGIDIMACGACILFPRLAFFAVSQNVVILALRAMISEFVFFTGMASICFSGLLFTLYTLSQAAGAHWNVRSIVWMMLQIWFGNTSLSFAQASSFHPIFGPVLMIAFTALSSTLLLTILISILSNTVARIDANATQEYLFQYSIATLEGVKSDALFSYQPPFNLLAFLLLKPASYILTPRALHTANVFLIRLTSFPILLVINFYERRRAFGGPFRRSRTAAHSIYNSLPRRIKSVPILEAIVGHDSEDLFEAIFEADHGRDDWSLFWDSDEDELTPMLRSRKVSEVVVSPVSNGENGNGTSSNGHGAGAETSDGIQPHPKSSRRSASRGSTNRRRPPSEQQQQQPDSSPRKRKPSSVVTGGGIPLALSTAGLTYSNNSSGGSSTRDPKSPLARLFFPRQAPVPMPVVSPPTPDLAPIEAGIRKMETMLEDIKGLPVKKLKDEMKELQDRQARIESLLLTLTRGMRNEASTSSSTTR